MSFKLLDSLRAALRSSGKRSSAKLFKPSVRLNVEVLEDRLVPAPLQMPVSPETDYFQFSNVPKSIVAGTSVKVAVTEYAYATGKVVSSGGVTSAAVSTGVAGTSLSPLGTITLTGGVGTVTFTPKTADQTVEIVATSGSLATPKTYVTGATGIAVTGPATQFLVTPGGSTTPNDSATYVTVTAEDSQKHIVTTYNFPQPPTFSASDGSPVTLLLSRSSWSNGVGTFVIMVTNPGVTTLTATAGAIHGTASSSITVTADVSPTAYYSGYVAADTGVTAVGATWVQPAVSGSGNSTSSTWVGIDGYGGQTVEQIGSTANVVNGQPVYFAWDELFPAYPVTIPITIHPGDTISAEVSFVSSTSTTSTFKFQMTDKPKGGGPVETYSSVQTMAGVAKRANAEWIEENQGYMQLPSSPLANFGQVTFTGAWATIGSTTGGINAFPNVLALNISSSVGNDVVSTNPPTVSNTLGFNEPSGGLFSSSFTITWG